MDTARVIITKEKGVLKSKIIKAPTMKVAHSTGKTAKMKAKRKEKMYAEQKELAKKKKKSHLNKAITNLIGFGLTGLLFYIGVWWFVAIIPMLIHLVLMFWAFSVEFYVKRNRERAYKAYMLRYGIPSKDGQLVIPPHVKMTHKKLIEQGKPIPM